MDTCSLHRTSKRARTLPSRYALITTQYHHPVSGSLHPLLSVLVQSPLKRQCTYVQFNYAIVVSLNHQQHSLHVTDSECCIYRLHCVFCREMVCACQSFQTLVTNRTLHVLQCCGETHNWGYICISILTPHLHPHPPYCRGKSCLERT